jgi:uncharacterized protein (DUF1778 family)
MANAGSRTIRSKRMNLRATPRQEQLIRTGAERTGVSVTDFILESACLQAEHVLADRRDFIVSARRWDAFVEALDRPARVKPELARLFSASSRRAGGPRK